MNHQFIFRRLINGLPQFSFSYGDEKQLHDGLATVLTAAGIGFVREHVAGPRDRFDFLCDGGVVIEAKIKGSASEALRQVDRYCERDDVKAVVIVTPTAWGKRPRWRQDIKLHGKPVRIVSLGGQAF